MSDEPVLIIGNGATALTVAAIMAPEITIDLGAGSSLDITEPLSTDGNIVIDLNDDGDVDFVGGVITGGDISIDGGQAGKGIPDDDVDVIVVVAAPPPSASIIGTGAEDLSADLGRSQNFARRLFSCPTAADPAAQTSCAWASAETGQKRVTGSNPHEDTTFSFAIGAQIELARGWFAGGAVGFDDSRTSATGSEVEAERFRAGLVVKYVEGPFTAGLGIAGAIGRSDLSRITGAGTAVADFGTRSVSIRGDVAYTHRIGEMFLQPGLGVGFTHLESDEYAETGAGAQNRTTGGSDLQSFGTHPRVRLGGDLILGPYETLVRPSLTLGLDWQSDTKARVATSAGQQVAQSDDLLGTVAAGLDVFAADDVLLRAIYHGAFGAETIGHAGELQLNLAF
ncbi:MAG: autotransporter domain-containing protein [Paracoccaceae bacterium]